MSDTPLPAQSEESFQAQVEQLAGLMGWKVYHTRYSFGSSKGFPDLVLVRAPRLIFSELKRDGKQPRPDQAAWLDVLGMVPGVETYLWHPADWETVVATLQR
jgi:hypothetical protein